MTDTQIMIIKALQDGLPLSEEPFREIARKIGIPQEELLAQVQTILDSEDDLVKVDITGSQEIKAVTIKADLGSIDKAKLEASLTETINRAIGESQKTAASKMGGMGLKLPGM